MRLESLNEYETLELLRQYLGLEQWNQADKDLLQVVHRWTGGLPLAVALVATLLKQGWSPPQILAQLQEGAVPIERVVERILNQVDTTLSKKQRQLLEALSVFAHPVDGEAVAAVAGMEDWRLIGEDLTKKATIEITDGRYVLHPLIRTYFRDRIAPERLMVLQQRMVQHYLAFIEESRYAFDHIDREWLNIQYAVETAYRNQLWESFIAFVLHLGDFLTARGYENEYRKWIGQALEISDKIGDSSARAALLHNLAVQYQQRGDLDRAVELYKQSLALKESTGNLAAESATLTNLGSVYRSRGDIRSAIAYYEQALAISRQIGDRLGEANILGSLGVSYADLGDYRLAITYYEEALAISRQFGDRRGEANVLSNLGAGYATLGEYNLATAYYEQALIISREIGDRRAENIHLRNLGVVYRDRYARTGAVDNLDIAIHFFERALDISREIGDRRTEANLYANLGAAYQDQYTHTGSADNLDIAVDLFHRALEFFGAEAYPVEYAAIQNNLGNAYVLRNIGDKAENIERAIAHYREALRVHPPDSPFVASSLHNLGVALSERVQVLGDRKEYSQAIEVLRQSLALTPPISPDWLRVASSLIKVYVEAGNWLEAKALSTKVLARAGTDSSSLETLLPWYQGLGDLAIQNQDLEFAARVFAEAIHRFEIQGKKVPDAISDRLVEIREQLGDDRFVLVWAEVQGILTPGLAQKMQEARQLMSQEQFGEAANRFSEAISLLSETELTNECKRQRATVFFLRGFCLRKQGLWEEALQDQERSFQIFEELRDYVGEAHTLLEMGHLLEVMNNYEEARLHYIDAYRLYRRGEDKRGMALASENLGRLEYRVRMFSQAVQDLEEARRLYISVGDRIKAATIESDLDAARASLAYQATSDNKQEEKR
ncbi:MAG: photosystem I assembly protein Ycf3 [Syntrophorhabdus sp. PtaU1.Bin153]|nr:MAG: photosystem I assembly protein Ycf3 [Syntrophorhabdus sp. PtaU1.Bin153]